MLAGGLWSVFAAAAGYALLWMVVEAGKIVFGREKFVFDPTEKFSWRRLGDDDAELTIGDEVYRWSEFFDREADRLELVCERIEIADHAHENVTLHGYHNRIELGTANYVLKILGPFSGVARQATIPREAMGFGDVNFLAAIGAFLGWKAVLFAVAAGSVVGSVVGLAMLPFRNGPHSLKLPFGPYLSIGALLWLFFGPTLAEWYFGLFRN